MAGVSQSAHREMWRLANGMCQMCRFELDSGVAGGLSTAQVAHIVSQADGGPRADPTMSIEDRNAVANLLLLCPRCHDLIDKGNGANYSGEKLTELKRGQETWAQALRQAGQLWTVSYSSIDYVNVPRLAMSPDGLAMLQAARQVGLDPARPFRGQGLAAGLFVGSIGALFDAWRQPAVSLEDIDLASLEQGMSVAFDGRMFSRNTPDNPWAGDLSGDISRDPHLELTGLERRIKIRYDPDWLTTATATTSLTNARSRPMVFAGFGLVVAITPDEIQVSARVFGQPEPAEAAYAKYVLGGRASEPEGLSVTDFGVDRRFRRPLLGAKRTVALTFALSEVKPNEIEQEVVLQLTRIVPELRRDLTLSSVRLRPATDGGTDYAGMAEGLLAGSPRVRSTHSLSGLHELLRTSSILQTLVGGLRDEHLAELHEELLKHSSSYRGMIEVDLERPLHRRFFGKEPTYRFAGASCSLV